MLNKLLLSFFATLFLTSNHLNAQSAPGNSYFDNWIQTEAARISSRCRNTWCDGQVDANGQLLPGHSPALSRNETLIIFEAAGLYATSRYGLTSGEREGLLRLMKSLAFNEAVAQGNWDKTPRHFYTLPLLDELYAEEGKYLSASEEPLNLDDAYGGVVPVVYGDDIAYCREFPQDCVNKPDTLGLGIWQITAEVSHMLGVLNGQLNTYAACLTGVSMNHDPGVLAWVGNPGGCDRDRFDPFRIDDGTEYGTVQIRLDFDRWLHDPSYNLTKSIELTRFKQIQLTDPLYQYVRDDETIIGPIPGVKMSPLNFYDWAQIGRWIETINGAEGWVPIFHGMLPYRAEPSIAVDAAVLAALKDASNTSGVSIDNNGENIVITTDSAVRSVYSDTWSSSMEKVLSQQQFSSESPRTFAALDTLLIIDSSGSMLSTDPDDRRLEAASTYVSVSAAEDYVGVIDFDGAARVVQPFTQLGGQGSAQRNEVQARIQAIDSAGSTDIAASLVLACTRLRESWQIDSDEQVAMVESIQNLRTEFPFNNISHSNERRARIPGIAHGANAKKVAILLTDGDTSIPYNNANQCFMDNGWVLYTIGFGGANGSRLDPLATATGGYYIEANADLLDLTCAYQRIRSHAAGEAPAECVSASVQQDETIALAPIEVESNQAQITFTSTWSGSDIVMTLYTPSGRVISRDTVAPDVFHASTPTSERYTIQAPEAGLWQVELYGADVPDGSTPVVVGVTSITAPVNALPIAHAGGPYSVELGSSLVLDASGANDQDGNLVEYRWDIGSNGSIEIATTSASVPYQSTVAFSDSLTLTVVDNDGYIASATTTIEVTEPTTPIISTLNPLPPACVLRVAQNAEDRTVVLGGTSFPFPRSSQNLQFMRTDSGAHSIYLGIEVDWRSAGEIALDVTTVESYLWPDSPRVPLKVRLTDYDPQSGGQLPISNWSAESVILATTPSTCLAAATVSALDPAPPGCVIRRARNSALRTLVVTGTHFPAPRTSQNLQFRRLDTGEESIYLGMEVDWRSDSEIALDIAAVDPYLWPRDRRVPVQVRITDYDPNTRGQVPVSEWSTANALLVSSLADCLDVDEEPGDCWISGCPGARFSGRECVCPR